MPWYKSEALAILALFICPPAGVILAWLQRWDPIVKTVASLFSLTGSVVLLLLLANASNPVEVTPATVAAQAAAAARPATAPSVVQASTAPANAAQAAAPAPIAANPSPTDDMNPKSVFSRAFSGLGAAVRGFAGDVTRPPSAPPATAPNPQPPVAAPGRTGASQPTQPAPSAAAPAPVPAGAAAPAGAPPVAPVPAAAANPAAPAQALTAAQKKDLLDTLSASVTHYSSVLDGGKAALGTTKYKDAGEAAAALDTPGSPAAKFNDWRDTSGVDSDTTFEDAYDKATTAYATAGMNVPPALDDWLTDMTDVQSALVDWADAAVDWQGQDKTDAELSDAEKAVRDGLNKAKVDSQKL